MTLQQLTYFLATAEHGSFSRAARGPLPRPAVALGAGALARGRARRRAIRPRRPRRRPHRGRPRLAPEAERVLAALAAAREAVAEVRGCRAARSASACSVPPRASFSPGSSPTSARGTRAYGCGWSARTRPRWPRTCAGADSRPGSSCSRSTMRGSRSGRAARGGRLRQPRAGARARPGHDRAARRRAADPLRRPLRLERPDPAAAAERAQRPASSSSR